MMLSIKQFTFNPFQENTYVLYSGKDAIIVDPGCYEKHEQDELVSYLESEKLTPQMLVNTHGHIDHVLGNAFVKAKFQIPHFIHALDVPLLAAVQTYASNYGFAAYQTSEADHLLEAGSRHPLGDTSFTILFVPGHAPGHTALYFEQEQKLISGDVLFHESIGRTDLPGGNHAVLLSSIRQVLYKLPDTVEVFPGHGPATTIGHEKAFNPFCPEMI
jgi:hydroxyacylglutathione hydrolase